MPKRKKRMKSEPIEIDFHGYRPEEAYEELIRLVDRVQGSRGFEIRVIHGKGSGTLASEVERFARNDPRIASAEKDFFNPGMTTLVLNGATLSPSSSTSQRTWENIPEPRVRRRKR